MPEYRKKPVIIEARQFTNESDAEELVRWIKVEGGKAWGMFTAPRSIAIETLEGTMTAQPDDYIIKGVQGEFYPCKPDIFDATYEPVEEDRELTDAESAAEEATWD